MSHAAATHQFCPLADENLSEKVGLLWIGEKFYPIVKNFMAEAKDMGISRRIPAVPNDFEIGDQVMLAHRKCIPLPKPKREDLNDWGGEDCRAWWRRRKLTPPDIDEDSTVPVDVQWRDYTYTEILNQEPDYKPGIFTIFTPRRIEYVCTGEEDQDELRAIVERGLTPVTVIPDVDTDSAGKDDVEEF